MRNSTLSLALLLVGAHPALAQQTTLELPLETRAPVEKSIQFRPKASPPKPASSRSRSASGRLTALPPLASRGSSRRDEPQAPPRVVTARVGTVVVEQVEIRAARETRSRLLSTATRGTNLAVLSDDGLWYGVLMVDNTMGWVPKEALELIDYQTQVTLAPERTTEMPRFDAADADTRSQALISHAFTFLGVPYVFGGNSRGGIDCSAFVRSVFASQGIALPRVSRDQAQVGESVEWSDLRPGDRLYFAMKGGTVDHCGIYLGNGYFIHASSNQKKVGVDALSKGRYSQCLVVARRS